MERNRLPLKTSILIALCGTAIACGGSSLIWEATYSTELADIATSSIVDNSGNVLITGTRRLDHSDGTSDYQGLLAKYSADGEPLWEQRYTLAHVSSVTPFGDDTLILTGSSDWQTLHQGLGDVYLANASDGTIEHMILDLPYDNLTDLPSRLAVQGETAYLLTPGTNAFIIGFDPGGNNTATIPVPGSAYAIEPNPSGSVYLLGRNNWDSGLRLYALDANAAIQWQSDDLGNALGTCGGYGQLRTVDIATDHQGSVIIKCQSALTKLNSDGSQIFATHYNDVFEEDSNATVPYYEYEHGPSQIVFDEHNDIYIATARLKAYYNGQLGALVIDRMSPLKSDLIVFKLDGSTGERIWLDDMDGFIFGSGNGATGDFYFPMSATLEKGKLQVAARAIRANFTGTPNNETPSLYYCISFADGPTFPVNTCNLDEVIDAYVRIVDYNTDTGSRSKGKRYEDASPTGVHFVGNGALIRVVDNTAEGTQHPIELLTLGWGFLEWDYERVSDSDIQISKTQY